MAKKKATKRAPARRRAPAKKSARRRGGVRKAGFGGAAQEVMLGLLGAVAASKLAPMIPVADSKMRNGLLAAGGIFIAAKFPQARSVGIGVGIASGAMLVADMFPNLLGPGATPTVGRLSPATQARMQAAAERMRGRINGGRTRTIVGTGDDNDNFGQPVNGPMRNRTIVGSGDPL